MRNTKGVSPLFRVASRISKSEARKSSQSPAYVLRGVKDFVSTRKLLWGRKKDGRTEWNLESSLILKMKVVGL
jgi:hypothetical protein